MNRPDGGKLLLYGFDEARKKLVADLKRLTGPGPAPASFPVVARVKVPLMDIDPLIWLAGQKNPRKVFWASAAGDLAVAGLGVAFEVAPEGWYGFNEAWDRVQECLEACGEGRLFTGMSFARTVSAPEWKGFPAMRFILPAVEVIRDRDGCWLAANAVRGRDGEPFSLQAVDLLEKMCALEQVMASEVDVISREDIPDYEDWVCSAEAVLESLDKEGFEKLVLARQVSLQLNGSFVPEIALKALMRAHKTEHAFLFDIDGAAFLGTSFDPLYEREGVKVVSRAVAGGRPRGKDRLQDDALGEELTRSDKDANEQRLVAGALVEVFREFCRSYQVDCEKELARGMEQPSIAIRVSGVLSEGVTDKEFLQALNPAPVTCGVPAEKARIFLQQYEVFDRGWFCGPVGFFSKARTQLAVSSRACLLRSGWFHAYAGATFVRGADPLARWEEAGEAMKDILSIVHGARG